MKIYNTDIFEKLKIRPVNVADLSNKQHDFEIVKNAVTDIDGNSYDGIYIGGKLWMTSNLRTTKYNDGTSILTFESAKSLTSPCYACPDVDEPRSKDYGLYYNFSAVKTEKLAPKGWYIPDIHDWTYLFECIAKNDKYNLLPSHTEPFNSAAIAKSLCSIDDWNSSNFKNAVGYDCALNNTTGFNGFPAGYYVDGKCKCIHDSAFFFGALLFVTITRHGMYVQPIIMVL